jgi:hypothetical protein
MHVMLDIETLGKKPGCVILSIGAKPFEPYGPSLQNDTFFYCQPAIFEQLMQGLTIDPETVDYWRSDKVTKEARDEFRSALTGPPSAIALEFVSWFERLTVPPLIEEINVWAKSPSFDCEILQRFLEAFNCKAPWNFRRLMDVRTIISVSGINEKDVPKSAGNIAHTALSDCDWQIAQVRAAYTAIKGPWNTAPVPATKHINIDARPLSERNTLELDDAEAQALRDHNG